MPLVALFVYYAIQAYILLILVWVLGSWFPQWREASWYRLTEDIVTPYMNLFRPLKLRIGTIDLTPMVAMLLLIVCQRFVEGAMRQGGG